MQDTPSPPYGTTRNRQANVSYGDVEGACFGILATGRRPSVDAVRQHLGRGSPATIATCLKRFWQTLGTRAEGNPAALARLPSEIAEFADGMWQRALTLAGQAAKHDDNAARERLEQIQIENDLRAQSFALREKEYETAARARERALADTRDHLVATMRMLDSDRQTMRARDARVADLEAQVEDYRKQLGAIVTRAVARRRPAVQRAPRATAKPNPTRTRSVMPRRPRRPIKSKSPNPRRRKGSKRTKR